MAAYEEIGKFFGVSIPVSNLDDILQLQELSSLLDREAIESIIPDRAPFLMLQNAAIFLNRSGNICVLSLAKITREDCEGHIPEERMAPLILFSKAIALTGRLIASFKNGGNSIVAEVIKTGEVRSLLSFSDLRHSRPPLEVACWAEIVSTQSERIIRVTTNTQSWIVGKNKFISAGKISQLEYAIIPKHLLLAALRHS